MMHDPDTANMRPVGRTSGSGTRPSREMSGPLTLLNLAGEAAALRQEASSQSGNRNAKTLVKESDLRLALTTLEPGAVIKEHRVPGTAAIHVLAGQVRLRLSDGVRELAEGHVAILEPNLPHDVEAVQESSILITIAWPGDLRGDEARV